MLFTLLAVLLLGSAAKAQTIHYVTPDGKNPVNGWEGSKTVVSLSTALTNAKAGDQIWVLGFQDPSQLYIAPEGGFTVKSGVKLYGGFRGTERTIDERPTSGKAPYFTYRSVLSGDIKGDDVVDGTNMLYPANSTRSDNATHVLSLDLTPKPSNGNNNTYPTVVNGFTVIGGNADGTGEYGGGIYVFGANANGGGAYHIEKCFLLNNYAKGGGGAIYVSSQVEATSTASTIVDCVVYNNIAGERSGSVNLGGGINIVGAGTIFNSSIFNCEGGGVLLSEKAKAVNVTVARNTVMGIGAADGVTSQVVFNSVIWGNSTVKQPSASIFHYCASDNATIAGNETCISISSESNGANSPLFEAPSVFTSFDRDFDWKKNAYPTWSWGILEGSALIDPENLETDYTGLPATDLAGESRKSGDKVDIGAYEYQHLDAGRIRYVKPDGTGDGTSWEKASGDLQKMIDELAAVDASGEVWVAAGEYRPTTQIIEGVQYAASFRMRDGIDVYGGFDDENPEDSKSKRVKGDMPWIYTNETILLGADYENGTATWANNQWNVTSSSRHVVWFAPMSGEEDFKSVTVLDGVTIKGGAANGGEGLTDFATDKGGGVYMGLNAILQNCIVTENTAKGDGGGVYANGDGADASSANANGGRVVGCLVYNNSSVEDGGGVFVKNAGLVLRSMITNNSAMNGAGVYLDKNAENHPEYLILSTSVVSNNTATGNGAVYCNESGVLLQNTIVNNDCPSTVDASNPNSSQTGGLYINKYAYVINSILWNNQIGGLNVPMYALGATAENVRFYNNAISGSSNAVWNNIYQTSTLKLSDDNASAAAIGPDFMGGYPTGVGVQGSLDRPSYYWEPKQGSNLRAGGLTIGTFPDNVLVAPELDIAGIPFAQKPAMGAHGVKANKITATNYEVFVDINYTGTDANGASWTTPYKSLNEVLAYFAQQNLPTGQIVKVHVKEGDYWPRYAYTNLDPKTATLSIPALPNGAKFEIYGGYAAESGKEDDKDVTKRFPTTYRTIINGNHEGKNIDEGIYHCITVETGANVVLDGFHVINGYAAGTATLRYGAGMLVRDGANVTVRNSIFENNTAEEAAAIDARGATLSLINCVVNNNTNTTETSSVVNAQSLTVNHVSVVNNLGAGIGAGNNSFSVGNSSSNSPSFTVDTNTFVNPTKKPGATLGFDTYLGGYSSFMPTGMNPVVNEGKNSDESFDITFGTRSLGGAPDLGAYEAELPADGEVIYVRQGATGNGSSWNNALGTIASALSKAQAEQEIWVSAGTYNERLTMKDGVNVLGGFAKSGNPNNELDGVNRDISNSDPDFMTTIDGQSGGRVLTQSDVFNTQTTWEGFVIQNGNVTSSSASENGGGIRILNNGIVKNCLIQNNTFNRTGDSDDETRGGGGIYAGEGARVENCIIKGNISRHQYDDRDWLPDYEVRNVLGGGAFIDGGMLINSIIVENKAENFHDDRWGLAEVERNGNILGAAAYVSKESEFYNCTFAYNYANSRGGAAAAGGVWDKSTNGSTFYNCVIWGNYANGNTGENTFQLSTSGYSQGGGVNTKIINCYISATSASHVGGDAIWKNEDLCAPINVSVNEGFEFYNACRDSAPFDNTTFELKNEGNGIHCINKGNNEYINNNAIYEDALGADRIQDCTVDKGAYEYTGSTVATDVNEFYVTPTGNGTADGSSAENAACEMMLQKVLNQAGKRVVAGEKDVKVKIAAKIDEEGVAREYNANTLSDPNDPQSYTFKVPAGITVEGGYTLDFKDTNRNPFTNETKLSPVADYRGQTVNGYHAVTFGDGSVTTIIDGVTLTGGKATSLVGNGDPRTQGGGAIVPAWGHIRNCRVYGNEAIQGGGLYLQPGALVSGTAVQSNSAEEGGGIYASIPQPTEEGEIPTFEPAHVVSSTVTDNTATENAGGIYFADGGALFLNMVVWGNTATSDNNVSGPVYSTFSDSKMAAASAANGNNFTEFYPFNYSFVERFELPSNMLNTAMTSDEDLYFAGPDRTLRAFSPLVNNGYSATLQGYLETSWNIAKNDMQGIPRIQDNINKIDVGAYAFLGGVIPDPKIEKLTKLFVNQTTDFRVADDVDLDKVVGRSFYTPLYHLDDALEYVRKAREAGFNDEIEIFVAQGTYKPTIRRTDAAAATETYDQRQNSFVVPAGVKIYGGFKGDEKYSYGLTSINGEGGNNLGELNDITKDSSPLIAKRIVADFNSNGISEPWELANQTILSGHVNASETAKNAYHVLYSSIKKEENGDITGQGTVTLDGLTVMDGETANELPLETKNNEIGRGGGLYSNGVNYIINRCRFLNNKGIRGNAAYVRGATATVIGSIFAGNSTVEITESAQAAGGALCLAADEGETAALKAVNTLWANNETTGNGGAIGYAVNASGSTSVNLMNNTIVRNKAANGNGAIYAQGGTVTNTLVWGNEGNDDNMSGVNASYSAAEDLDATDGNIKLAAANTSIDGPRFAQPSDAAGAAANDPMTKWNPASINVLTDAGDGVLATGKDIAAIGEATGAYKDWWTDNENPDWTNAVDNYATKFMRTDDGNSYYCYTGPRDENGLALDRTIDIGLYEYQYVTSFSNLDAVYVATTEAGDGSGDSWANATSDLRGAIIAMANPTGGSEHKAVYIRDGEYSSKQLLTGTAFPLNMDAKTGDATYVNSLTIKGSYNEANKQDFSKPTVITSYSGVETQRLMNIATNGKPVFIEGIMFNNATANGDGIVSTGDNLTLGNVAFRGNAGTGVSTSGKSLIYNALFADGGTGLNVGSGDVKVVNATFANNGTAIKGTASVFNSVSWKSGEDLDKNFVNDDNTAKNNAVLGNAVNDNIQNGPNFVDPSNENILLRDYRIRPSMMLLNKGNDAHYKNYVEDVVVEGINYVDVEDTPDPKRPKHQYDLANVTRKVGTIDIGAYEYAAPLSQILYVKSGVVGSDESGESWTNAISDLQGAINLASIYVNNSPEEDTGYVFVHSNVAANNVRVAMPGVKAYGSMNDETSTKVEPEEIVSDILGKRSSILDLQRRSTINGLTVGGAGSVVDGFEVSGTVAVSDGMLSTSIVKPTDAVTVTGDGVLYNSFVDGAVSGKAVNVTATGAIDDNGGGNNNPKAIENGYVSVDYWKYQLKDDSGLFDKAEKGTITAYMKMAGHSKDLSGSIRVRNGFVDFGCFETWNITANTEISATDKPTRNHVVYVRNGAELKIAKDVYTGEATAFNPGFLLLENGSGLLANGNYVGLTNFAMERTIPAKGTALTYVPFLIDKMDNASGATFQKYDGAKRAGYDYLYSATDGAWEPVTNPATEPGGIQAFAINNANKADAKVRFYGTSYKETPNDVKMVQLMKFNFNDPWTTNADGTINPNASNRFTHKENMSWNMFGSPYLHAMNYKDMEYGRVIYTGSSYETKNTADTNTSGSVAMGEGVFTQSATLQDYETFTVTAPTAGSDPQGLRGLLVAVAPADAEEADDFIQLKAVESEEASSEFNIAADGVKWMSDNASVAQIYMARNGGRYSMLSALDINGAVSLGLTIPEAAAYTIAIDEEAWMDEYETVVLEDKTTGQMVDLLECAYQFQATEAGTVEDRFSIRFNRIVDGLGDNVKAYSPSAGMIRVEGAAAGSLVRIYDLNGRCIRVGETSVVNYDVNVGPKGIYLVEVQQKEAEPVVKKVQVK